MMVQSKLMLHCVLLQCSLKIRSPFLLSLVSFTVWFFCLFVVALFVWVFLVFCVCILFGFFFSLRIACSGSWNARFSNLSLNCCHGLLFFLDWNYKFLLETVLFSFIFTPHILYDHLMNALNSNTRESDSHAPFTIFFLLLCSPFHAPDMAWTFFLSIVNR